MFFFAHVHSHRCVLLYASIHRNKASWARSLSILFDANKPGDLEKAEQLGADILKSCVELGGCLTGEHGVGVEKRDLMALLRGDPMTCYPVNDNRLILL